MEIKNNMTKVRYGVHYRDLNYEYALHSNKRHFLRNMADVVNVIEYCVTQELKKNGYKVDHKVSDAIEVIRFVNDKEDDGWKKKEDFKNSIKKIVDQIVIDTIQRTK